jgi:lipopolysaccharide/colanic/teichoic acid biosynthesis glycosyltransferase
MTGLWQVSGRSDTKDFHDVVHYDLKYIDEWSLWMDAKILARTLVKFGTGR